VFDTNVHGAYYLCRAVLPGMVARRSGAILLTASDFAIVGLRNYANYAAAKTALYALTKSLALEFAGRGIRVNAVGPGPIDTPQHHQGRTREEWDAWLRGRLDRIPMGRLGTPEEVASVVDFLLSDRAGYVSGQLVQPNGGQVMW
jgi:3-oxoacyl-[acyl-carrier protein] reductase